MGIKDIIKKSFIEGYATADIQISTIVICIVCTALLGMYIYSVYKHINKNSFYNKNFNLSLISLAIITAAIILTIQSNIVVSLGMVGALSIVRFRTAIKDPMDLAFLFWSISIGIICGAGFALIAVVFSTVLTIIIVYMSNKELVRESLVLVINAKSISDEKHICEIVEKYCSYYKIKARNISKSNVNMAIEIMTDKDSMLITELLTIDSIVNCSLLDHDGEITV